MLRSEDFKQVVDLRALRLRNNDIGQVDGDIFTYLRNNLMLIDLSQNKIHSLQGCVRFLSALISLNLEDNRIEGFEDDEFEGVNLLEILVLRRNRITTLGSSLHKLVQLELLRVESNRLRTLGKEQIPANLRHLFLADNPFHCDCQMLFFLNYLNSTDSPIVDFPVCTPLTDASPIPLPSDCPPGCRCFCAHDAQRHFMSVDCSSLGLTRLPALFSAANGTFATEKNSTSIMLFSPMKYKFVYKNKNSFRTLWTNIEIQDKIAGLDVTNNSLQSMEEARLPEGMVHLFLCNNQFHVLPTGLLNSQENLSRVTLSGNPWDCDCGTINFKKWIISKPDVVQDANITKCGPDEKKSAVFAEKAIWSLTDLDLCPENIVLYVTLGLLVPCFLLMVAVGKIAWTRYQMHVKVWLYSHGVTWVKEKDIDKDKEFDAFISFSHKDQDVVIPELIEQIEAKDPKVKLFIHYKHFLPGEFIQLNILRAIEVSKRTVLVLSKSFLESEWCMFEFRVAHIEALKDNMNRIIIIKMDNLPKDEDLPEEIQVYLQNTTYLTWGDKYFWDTLLYTLPRS
ncbi:protein toll [Caerostris darwini]|uniref:Protein toll n=1 Tax=Caerostris darwini TaxID=1538125 RepID=A0AAV4PJZ8_9ARAC|nr:protein toll [Caerostris darwini]